MTLVYCTNIWNHHQGPVCRELARLLGDDFKMILHQPLDHRYSKERIALGWNLNPPNEPWIVRAPETCADLDYDRHRQLFMAADVAVYNSELPYVTQEMLVERRRAGKINMRMGERLFRNLRPWYYAFWPRKQAARWLIHHRFEAARVHYLTMGHWCAKDLEYLHVCRNRTWRWGYLTSVSSERPMKPAHSKVRIGWCGRFLCLKNVSDILQASSLLEDTLRRQIEITLVGDGPERENLVRMSHDLRLDDIVKFEPFMSASEAKAFMRGLDIYVFPSGRLEGWGAALAEAMDASCAVIANEAAGATLELVRNGENGFTYKDGDLVTLAQRLCELIKDAVLRERLGLAAWRTMQNWSPAAGAERLVALARRLCAGDLSSVGPGLCERVR